MTDNALNELDELMQWYRDHCNGDWEHSYGVLIDTLDNPGWNLKIDLEGTELAMAALQPVIVHRSDSDWFTCRVENGAFWGFGGPGNLAELLREFLEWSNSQAGTDSAQLP